MNCNQENELLHYGVPGMKWGVRRSQAKLDRLAGRVKKGQEKRREAGETHGFASKKYRDASKDLYLTRSKYNLQKAKMNKDVVSATLAKDDIKNARRVKREGTVFQDAATKRKVYGSSPKPRDMLAINIKEGESYSRRYKVKNAVKKSMAVVGPLAASSAVAYYSSNRVDINKKLNPKAVNAINKGMQFIYKLRYQQRF